MEQDKVIQQTLTGNKIIVSPEIEKMSNELVTRFNEKFLTFHRNDFAEKEPYPEVNKEEDFELDDYLIIVDHKDVQPVDVIIDGCYFIDTYLCDLGKYNLLWAPYPCDSSYNITLEEVIEFFTKKIKKYEE